MSVKGRGINKSLLPTEKYKEFELPPEGQAIDYSRFKLNNWVKPDSDNGVLKALDTKGGAVWLGHDWTFYWRRSQGAKISDTDKEGNISRTLTNLLERKNEVRFMKSVGRGRDALGPEVCANDLLSVEDDFTPFALSEFYLKEGQWYRTSFYPTEYLKRNFDKKDVERPETILKLIRNLANDKEEYFNWILNWIAGFFQTLRKSQVSLVLRGDQGAGKGIFFYYVIMPLFGEDFSMIVDNENLESDFKNWIEGRLFLNLNEIATDMKARRNVKNFLKQLVTDKRVHIQTKFKDFKPVDVFANILITSNEVLPIEIEPTDRRFTVMQTGKGLKKQGWNMTQAVANICAERPAFAEFLSNYKVDWVMYDTALDTPEKGAIEGGTTSNIRRFANAIEAKNLKFFEELDGDGAEATSVYYRLQESFEKKLISQTLICDAFEVMFETKKSAKKVMSELRTQNVEVFGLHKMKRSGNAKFYEL